MTKRKKSPRSKPTKHTVREAWLEYAIDHLRSVFEDAGYSIPANVRVSVGFPYSGKNKMAGECWDTKCSADNAYEVFISPKTANPAVVLSTLAHEIVHTIVGPGKGHKKVFKQCAAAIGLEGKITATYAGEELAEKLHAISIKLGPYPHGALLPVQKEKQTTRLLKLECKECGCVIRTTQKWLDEYPQDWPCPCGGKYIQEIKSGNGN